MLFKKVKNRFMNQDSTDYHQDKTNAIYRSGQNIKDAGLYSDFNSKLFLEKVPLHWLGLNTFE